MEKLNELLTNLEALKESEGDFNIGLELELSTVIGALLATRHDIEQAAIEHDARELELERVRKHSGELELSAKTLSQTISEQSETLENRAELLNKSEAQVQTLLQQVEDLTLVHERVKGDALQAMQGGGAQDNAHFILADSLDAYSLACARIAEQDAHPMVIVTLIQMANHMRTLPGLDAVNNWLRGIPPQS